MLAQIKNIDENNSDKTYAVAIPLVSNIIPNVIVPDVIVINEINALTKTNLLFSWPKNFEINSILIVPGTIPRLII